MPPDPEIGYSPRQISIASTCYAASGMPLAFTQEDFLSMVILKPLSHLKNVKRKKTIPFKKMGGNSLLRMFNYYFSQLSALL